MFQHSINRTTQLGVWAYLEFSGILSLHSWSVFSFNVNCVLGRICEGPLVDWKNRSHLCMKFPFLIWHDFRKTQESVQHHTINKSRSSVCDWLGGEERRVPEEQCLAWAPGLWCCRSTVRWTASRGLSWGGCRISSRFLNRPSNVGYGMWGRNGNRSFNPVISTALSNSATAEKFVSWKNFFFSIKFLSTEEKKKHLTVSSHHALMANPRLRIFFPSTHLCTFFEFLFLNREMWR